MLRKLRSNRNASRWIPCQSLQVSKAEGSEYADVQRDTLMDADAAADWGHEDRASYREYAPAGPRGLPFGARSRWRPCRMKVGQVRT